MTEIEKRQRPAHRQQSGSLQFRKINFQVVYQAVILLARHLQRLDRLIQSVSDVAQNLPPA